MPQVNMRLREHKWAPRSLSAIRLMVQLFAQLKDKLQLLRRRTQYKQAINGFRGNMIVDASVVETVQI